MSVSFSDETLDHIFSFVDEREHLLSPILVSKRFSSIVQPHLRYRVISCTLRTTDLWNHLSVNAVLARNVRKLEIQRQLFYLNTVFSPPIVPRDFVAQANDPENRKFYEVFPVKDLPQLREAEHVLIRAIKNMTNLKSFSWNRCAPLIDSKLDKDVRDDLWTALGVGCPALEHLYVMDASENKKHRMYIRPVHHSAIWSLRKNLKSFQYHSYAYRHVDRSVPTKELVEFLLHCPNLEALSVGFTLYDAQEDEDGRDISSADLNGLLVSAHWPKLHTLRTFSVHVSPSTAAKFFKRHPTLAHLDILEGTSQARFLKDETFDPQTWPHATLPLTLLPDSLPNLKSIYAPKYISESIVAQALSSDCVLDKKSAYTARFS